MTKVCSARVLCSLIAATIIAALSGMPVPAVSDAADNATDNATDNQTATVLPEMVLVEAGNFMMGMDVLKDVDAYSGATERVDAFTGATPMKEWPAHQVTMPSYWIGAYEVTNEEFAEFVDAGGYEVKDYWLIDSDYHEDAETGWSWKEKENRTAPAYIDYSTGEESGWDLSKTPYWADDVYSNKSDTPVVGVSWYEAYAYCNWLSEVTGDTYRLPTEAEWEYAARGPDSNIFPWGDSYLSAEEMCGDPGSGAMANCWVPEDTDSHRLLGFGALSMQTGGGAATSVGSYPAGVSYFGVYDMAGNVMEWTADWFQLLYYPRQIKQGETTNPQGPDMAIPPFFVPVFPFWTDPCRSIRSQGFIQDPVGETNYSMHPTYPLRGAHRQFVKRYGGTFYLGFRVVKDAE